RPRQRGSAAAGLAARAARAPRAAGRDGPRCPRGRVADPLRSRRRDRLASRPAAIWRGARPVPWSPVRHAPTPPDGRRLRTPQARVAAAVALQALRRSPVGVGALNRADGRDASVDHVPHSPLSPAPDRDVARSTSEPDALSIAVSAKSLFSPRISDGNPPACLRAALAVPQ